MRIVAALLLLVMLTGCGQKGPLYRPGDTSEKPPQEREDDRQEVRQQ